MLSLPQLLQNLPTFPSTQIYVLSCSLLLDNKQSSKGKKVQKDKNQTNLNRTKQATRQEKAKKKGGGIGNRQMQRHTHLHTKKSYKNKKPENIIYKHKKSFRQEPRERMMRQKIPSKNSIKFILCLSSTTGCGPALQYGCIPNETAIEKTNFFSFGAVINWT